MWSGASASLLGGQHRRIAWEMAADGKSSAQVRRIPSPCVRVVVNHLSFAEPIPDSVIESARDAVREVVAAGGLDARFVRVDETHAILVLTFPDLETEERVKTEVGGPWMREHVVPLLTGPPERSTGEVVAGTS